MEFKTMGFKLNFLGITVADFEPSFRFYTELLGIEAKHSKPDWAAFQTKGMKFELFSGGSPLLSDRSWGRGQAIRPSFQVADLKSTISDLRRKGVAFVGDIQKTTWGESIEFTAPEGIRWTLVHAPSYPFGTGLRNPHLGLVEIKTQNLLRQRTFYADVMGLQPSDGTRDQVIFQQEPGEPLLFMEPSRQPLPAIQSRSQDPIFISFETGNIKQAATYLKSHSIHLLTDISTHRWGIDFFIKDVDGNSVQIVQYIRSGSI